MDILENFEQLIFEQNTTWVWHVHICFGTFAVSVLVSLTYCFLSTQVQWTLNNFPKTVGILQFYDVEEEEAIIVPPSARGVAPRRRWRRGQQPRFVSRDSEDLYRRGVFSPAFS